MIVTTTCRITTDETVRGPNVVVPPEPVTVGIINVSDLDFKAFVESDFGDGAILRVYVEGLTTLEQTFFTWNTSANHFEIEDTAVLVETDLLNVSTTLEILAGEVDFVRFLLTNGSNSVQFLLDTEFTPYMEEDTDPIPAMVDTTLIESYSGGPQHVTVQNMDAFEFHIKAKVTLSS